MPRARGAAGRSPDRAAARGQTRPGGGAPPPGNASATLAPSASRPGRTSGRRTPAPPPHHRERRTGAGPSAASPRRPSGLPSRTLTDSELPLLRPLPPPDVGDLVRHLERFSHQPLTFPLRPPLLLLFPGGSPEGAGLATPRPILVLHAPGPRDPRLLPRAWHLSLSRLGPGHLRPTPLGRLTTTSHPAIVSPSERPRSLPRLRFSWHRRVVDAEVPSPPTRPPPRRVPSANTNERGRETLNPRSAHTLSVGRSVPVIRAHLLRGRPSRSAPSSAAPSSSPGSSAGSAASRCPLAREFAPPRTRTGTRARRSSHRPAPASSRARPGRAAASAPSPSFVGLLPSCLLEPNVNRVSGGPYQGGAENSSSAGGAPPYPGWLAHARVPEQPRQGWPIPRRSRVQPRGVARRHVLSNLRRCASLLRLERVPRCQLPRCPPLLPLLRHVRPLVLPLSHRPQVPPRADPRGSSRERHVHQLRGEQRLESSPRLGGGEVGRGPLQRSCHPRPTPGRERARHPAGDLVYL